MPDQEKQPHLAQSLKDLGYIGATGSTPYKAATSEQLATLQSIYNNTNISSVARSAPRDGVFINVNFDGTWNNGQFPEKGESPTNIFELSKLQQGAPGVNPDNTIYMPGVGAQTLPTSTINPKTGLVADEASPSKSEVLPWNAGKAAQAIMDKAYDRLKERITATLAEDPNAKIYINLTGFSRGAAQAVAFANMLKDEGIGPYKPGDLRIANMLLLDPVDQTNNKLNTKPPTNVINTLVLVATDEGRNIMPAMHVSKDAKVMGVPVVHSGLGGSYNPQGTASVVLQKGKEFMQNGGTPMAEIPNELKPNWKQMLIHNSSVDNYGVPKLGATMENWEKKPARHYESTGFLNNLFKREISVQESLKKLPDYPMGIMHNSDGINNSKPEAQMPQTEKSKEQAIEKRAEQTFEPEVHKPLNRYPEPDWSGDWRKPVRIYNQEDGTSTMNFFNSDHIIIRQQQLDVNGVDVTPKHPSSTSPQNDVSVDHPKIKISM